MYKKIKNFIKKTDRFLYKKFGSDKSTKSLENIKEARIIFSHINEPEKETKIRFVGGCVRKAISGEKIDDIDLATSLEPEEIKKKLSGKENIKVFDTGISHGTITVILNEKKFEITTLRKDVSTDGRHAKVEFTTNWEIDASRRDFTINAIYSDIDGRIFDPLNGVSDLRNGLIKFAGLPEERIHEDYLRILRYLRFFTHYSKIDHNENVILAIKKNINGLNKISNERIFSELQKILNLKNFYNLFSYKQSKEIILNIFPQFKYYERLKKIYSLNEEIIKKYDAYLILALLIIDHSNDYEYFCHKYKVSNKIKEKFKNISSNFKNLQNKQFYYEKNIKKLIYLLNKESVLDLLLFSICVNHKKNFFNIKELMDYIKICKVPEFPISGEYLKKYGYKTGLKLGKKLKNLEEEWIKNNFFIDKKEIEKSLRNEIKN